MLSVLAALVSVPLTLHYLGSERYGIWLTISSFVTVLAFADLGLGNGLLNRIASAHGQSDRLAIRRYVSSGLAMLVAIGLLILIVFSIAYPNVAWEKLFNAHSPIARKEAGPAIAVFAVCFALTLPATLVQKVQTGLQEGFLSSAWQCIGSTLSLAGIIAATHFKLGLPWLVLIFVGSPLLASLLNSFLFFCFQQKDISPKLEFFSLPAAYYAAKTGVLFLILQVVAAVSYSSDPLIISHILGPATVPQYSVPERMFSLIGMIIAIGLTPLWPAYGEAISRKDHDWVKNTFKKSFGFSILIAAAASTVIGLFAPFLLRIWVGPSIHASWQILLGFAIWKVIEAGSNSVAMFMNGAHIVRFQVFLATTTGAAILALKFIFVSHVGVYGSVWANIVAFSLITAPALFFKLSKLLEGPENR